MKIFENTPQGRDLLISKLQAYTSGDVLVKKKTSRSTTIVVYVETKARADRRKLLKKIAKDFQKEGYDAKFKDNYGSGMLLVGAYIAILCKPVMLRNGLRPINFHLNGTNLKFNSYVQTLLKAIENNQEINDELSEYLSLLVNYEAYPRRRKYEDRKRIEELFADPNVFRYKAKIATEFGECLGSIKVVSAGYFGAVAGDLSSRILYPTNPSQRLLDFTVEDFRGKKISVSCKSGVQMKSSVVKPLDVLQLLGKKQNKWNQTTEYNVMLLLNKYSIVIGPLVVGCYLAGEFPNEFKGLGADQWGFLDMISDAKMTEKEVDGTDFVNQVFSDFKDYSHIQGQRTKLREISMVAVKSIEKLTKSKKLNVGDLFKDAIKGKVHYLKLKFSRTGIPIWDASVYANRLSLGMYGDSFFGKMGVVV